MSLARSYHKRGKSILINEVNICLLAKTIFYTLHITLPTF